MFHQLHANSRVCQYILGQKVKMDPIDERKDDADPAELLRRNRLFSRAPHEYVS